MPRPPKVADTADMVKAARLYYKDHRSKKEIGGMLRSPTNIRGVTWLLKEAEKKGVIRIQIHETAESSLEKSAQAKFPHLHRVLIAAGKRVTTPEGIDDLHHRWAFLAADYFDELWEKHPRNAAFHVGVTGGDHLSHFVNVVPERTRENVKVHVAALIGRGRLEQSTSHTDPIVTASILWSHCGSIPGNCEYATVPPYVSDGPGAAARKSARAELARSQGNLRIREVIEALDDLDVVFGGIGTVNPGRINSAIKNRMTMTGLLQDLATTSQLEKEGIVGDFAYCPFNDAGNSKKDWQFFLTPGHFSDYPGIAFYKRMAATEGKKVIAFGGPYKMPAIKAALKAKIFNVWITDEDSARQIAEGDID